MFSNLFNLAYKRTKLQALGFYIVWLLLLMFLAALFNIFMYILLNPHAQPLAGFEAGYKAGMNTARMVIPIFSFVSMALLSFGIIAAKKIFNVKTFILAIIAILITPVFGGWIGMLFPAILTTFDDNNDSSDEIS